MICADIKLEGNVSLGNENVIQNKVTIIANNNLYDIETPKINNINNNNNNNNNKEKVIIGDKNNIEDCVSIINSNIGNENLIEIGVVIDNSIIGNLNKINVKAKITNSRIGNFCTIGSKVVLNGVTIPDNSSVYCIDNGTNWRCSEVDMSHINPLTEAYRQSLLSLDSLHCINKNMKVIDELSSKSI